MRFRCMLLGIALAAGLSMTPRPALAASRYERHEARERAAERWENQPRSHGYRYRDHDDRLAVEPYWAYPEEYYIFNGHPSRYYYTYPDRYYAERYYYPDYDDYGFYEPYPEYGPDVYGYREPYFEPYYEEPFYYPHHWYWHRHRDWERHRWHERHEHHRHHRW